MEDSANEDDSTIALVVPQEGSWFRHEDEADPGWYIHEEQEWMYNEREGIYFHVDSRIIVAAGNEVPRNLVSASYSDDSCGSECEASDNVDGEDHGESTTAVQDDPDKDISVDFEKDLSTATVCRKGNSEHKEACEDFYVTRECMSIHLVSRTEALCYYTGVFDGHGGYKCAEYLTKHLKNNILSVYRQAVSSLEAKRTHQHSFPTESIEVRALKQGCTKGFEMTDNNFCNAAKQFGLLDGSTATVSLIYGPDEDGYLKLITAHVGDSRAILCSMVNDDGCFAQPMTCDHKPNNAKERQHIEERGGTVKFTQGAWRCISRSRNGQIHGVATSRAFGNYPMKHPNRIVSSEPDISVYTINFDSDLFLVLVTDGITAVLSNQQIVDIVCEAIDEECTADAAAERVVTTAEQLGSQDDKTCTVMYFGWHKELYQKCVRDKDEDAHREAMKVNELEERRNAAEKDDDMFSA